MSIMSFSSLFLVFAILLQTNFALAQNSCRSLILRLNVRSQNETSANTSIKQRSTEPILKQRSAIRS